MPFERTRLTLARERRRLTALDLAKRTGRSSRTVRNYEKGDTVPDDRTVKELALALRFAPKFFYGPPVDLLSKEFADGRERASFRSRHDLRARDRASVLAAGVMASIVAQVVAERFHLPAPDVPELDVNEEGPDQLTPEAAAAYVRDRYNLGDRPIKNVLHVLEAHGIRVFRLTEDLTAVDAFCFRGGDAPYVLLNSSKSGERSRFDAAHELGHLVMHRHVEPVGREAETQAHRFASAFLAPPRVLRKELPRTPSFPALFRLKRKWGMSVAALVKAGHRAGVYNDWQAKRMWIEINKRGWRKAEPHPLAHEQSQIYAKVAGILHGKGESLESIAAEVGIQGADVRDFVVLPEGDAPRPMRVARQRGNLQLLV
ncbi:MAG: ImmA/IrrE family metallo-endopeptidase, partial [Planctomycetes bacterium]|nr:ImmA/IrrE family metallo-endopeptidase [Planctomycetota bacterium]